MSSSRERPVALVADDDPSVRRLIAGVLEADGFEVVAVADGVRALAAVPPRRPALVVTDWRMPRLGGPSVVSAAREVLRGVPIVVVTGDPGAAADFVDPGDPMIRIVAKPFAIDDLRRAVAELLPP